MDKDVINLAKSIRQTESGGDFNAKGKSGESGAYQWTPNTWKAQAKSVLGDENAKMTPSNQNAVAYTTLKQWKDKGLNPAQIAAKWNSGSETGWENKVGTNKFGVHYDVPKYVKSVTDAYQQIKGGGSVGADPNNPSSTANPDNQEKGFFGSVGSDLSNRLGQAGGAISKTFSGEINPFSGILQTAGAGAGAIGDVIGEGLKLIPGVKRAEGLLGQGVGKLAQTGVGQKVVGGVESFAQNHPELSADIGAVGNIAGLVGGGIGGKVAKDVVKEGVYSAAKEGVIGSGAKALVEKSALKKATQVLETTATVKQIGSAVRTGRVGAGKGVVSLAPDPLKEASIKEIMPLVHKGMVVPGKAAENAVAIKSAADQTAEEMRSLIKSQEIQPILQPERLQEMAQKVISRSDEALPSGENPAKALLDVFYKHLPKGKDITAEDILNARQAVSSFVLEHKGDWSMRGVMTGFKSARNAIWDESRTLLAEMAPHVPVRELLSKQTNLYRALDYLPAAIKKEINAGQKGAFARYFAKHPVQGYAAKQVGKGLLIGAGLAPAAHFVEGL